MHTETMDIWQHAHSFGQEQEKKGEKPTLIVIAITCLTMVVEIVTGILFGSMALLADGLHMGTHALALGIAAAAYAYTRRHATDERYSFGTGKVNVLGAFSSALLLAVFAILMVWESVERLFSPVQILFNQAIGVAAVGLLVNAVCMVILSRPHAAHGREHGHAHHHDHNLRAALLHVGADALTSLFAIIALLAGKFWGLIWMDPAMGIVGAAMVARWAWKLLRQTTGILLDEQAPASVQTAVREALETGTDRIADLHIWTIGPGLYAANLSVVTDQPHGPEHYKAAVPDALGIAHMTVEVQPCREG